MKKEEKILMIVESPNKCKSLREFLPSNYTVMASVGHITYIDDTGKYNMGIDTENGFVPDYKVDPKKKDVVKMLKENIKLADRIVLASDGDNEGELISYQLRKFLKIPDDKYDRVTYHEITKKAVMEALENPRKIDDNKAMSAISRAILDKIVGYRISPIVFRKVGAKSAGRVQSAALKILAMREDEIAKFVPSTYYEIWLPFTKNKNEYKAQYKGTDKKKIVSLSSKETADKIVKECKEKEFVLKNIEDKERKISTKLPFTTSTFQQEASSKLGINPKRAMECAQKLFEGLDIGGKHVALITYLRTDSSEMNGEFVESLSNYVKETYGKEYYQAVKVSKKTKNVQDAHEAIRPVDLEMTPSKLSQYIEEPQLIKVYKLIYERTVASSMKDAIMVDTEYSIYNGIHRFAFTSHKVKFDGFKKVYCYKEETEDDEKYPSLKIDEVIKDKPLNVIEKTTSAPSRYSETALVKKLDEAGIGRPSTTANTINILEDPDRGYTEKEGKLLKVTEKGMKLSKFLDTAFGDIINLTYTTEMETDLDKISDGKIKMIDFLTNFYEKLNKEIESAKGVETDRPKVELVGRKCPLCGKDLVYRVGKYGKFIACSGYNGKKGCNYSERIQDPNKPQKTAPTTTSVKCPDCGAFIVKRVNSRNGTSFFACSGFPKHKRIFSDLEFNKLLESQAIDSKSKDRD